MGLISIRRAGETDASAIALLSTTLGYDAEPAAIVESGFRVEITGLIVAAEQRRHGVGRAFVAEAESWVKLISAEAIVARGNIRRVESHAFYPALGYSAAKTQNVYRKILKP